jgi:hypothetical protein
VIETDAITPALPQFLFELLRSADYMRGYEAWRVLTDRISSALAGFRLHTPRRCFIICHHWVTCPIYLTE